MGDQGGEAAGWQEATRVRKEEVSIYPGEDQGCEAESGPRQGPRC